MAKFKVLHTQAGPFPQGREVTDKEIEKAGYNVEHWLGHKAIEQIDGDPVKVEPKAPVIVSGKPMPQASSAPHPHPEQANAEADRLLKEAEERTKNTTGNNADPAKVPPIGGPGDKPRK